MDVLLELLKIPNLVQSFEEGQSCSLKDCPFFESCPGVDRSILIKSKWGKEDKKNWHFVCNMKALKKIYQNGEKNKSGDRKHQEDMLKFYGEIRPTQEKMQT